MVPETHCATTQETHYRTCTGYTQEPVVTVSVQEVIERIATILDRPIRIETDPAKVRAVERQQLQADVRALRALIGWSPHGDLTRGLRELLVYEGVVREGVAQ